MSEIDLLQRLEERAVAMEREGHVTVARYLRLAAGDIADLRDLLEQARKALTALYEACERRANEEGGDFGDVIGPAAELAEAALSASPSPRRHTVSDLLLPCPFCGQKAYIRKRHHSTMPRDPTYQAYCDDCGCGTSDLYRQPALAIQAWNQRALAEIEPAPSDGGER